MCDTLHPPPPCINEEMQYQVPSVRKRQGGSPGEEMEEGAANVAWHFSGLLSPNGASVSLGLSSRHAV